MLEMLRMLRYIELGIPISCTSQTSLCCNRETMPKGLRSRLSFTLVVPAVYQGNVLNFQSSSCVLSFVLFLLVSLQRLIAFTALIYSVHWGEHKLHIASAHVGMDKAALACWCFTPSGWRFTFPPFRYPPSQIIALEIRFWIYNNLQPECNERYLLQGLSDWTCLAHPSDNGARWYWSYSYVSPCVTILKLTAESLPFPSDTLSKADEV